MKDYFILDSELTVTGDERMDNETVKKLWNSFSLTKGKISFEKGEKHTFRWGNTSLPVLAEEKEYVLKADENGIAIVGKDYGGLMRGFVSLLMKIQYDYDVLKIKTVTEESNYTIKNRMIHICVFPENDLYYIKKLIRLSALCQYTHIVIEFWGMLKYDCLKELAWPHAFTKAQVKEIITEATELGIQPVPMFNMFGHATASRLMFGKHVVLDQNPLLQHFFTPDGWAWDIRSDEVYNLLTQIRNELYELFGHTEYFHIGCDEAYYYTMCDDMRAHLPKYLAKLTNAVEAEGRKPMMWMDMILERSKFPKEYYAFGKDDEAAVLLKSLSNETVMVDWQYNVKESPIKSSLYLKEKDPDKKLIIAPWYNACNYNACIDTAKENNMFGIMLTTWHTLKDHMPSILSCAIKCGAKTLYWSDRNKDMQRTETATLLRRVSFEGNTYPDCGWSKEQIEV